MAQTYSRRSNKLLLRGMNITLPQNRLGMEWAQFIKNLRCYRLGEWRQRPGTTLIADVDVTTDPVIWISRINDVPNGTFRRLVGTTAGSVFVDNAAHNAFSLADSGYSGNPWTSVIARPQQTPLPYMFVANEDRQSKFDLLGARTNWGLSAPVDPPTAELLRIAYRVIDTCYDSAPFGVTNGVRSTQVRVPVTAIDYILYDSGSTGWASVAPVSMDENYQEGMFITTSGSPETVIVESVYLPITSTTIAGIRYDSGSTGLCTIQLATPTAGLQRNSLILLNSTEAVRVLSVTMGLDEIPSFRCSTVGTFAVSDTVDGLRSFRAYFDNNHTAAEDLNADYTQDAVAAAGISTLSRSGALDLASTNIGGDRPIRNEDYIHISIKVNDFTLVDEIQLQFDVDAATNDFTRNYFFKSIRPPDLQAAYTQSASSLTAQQQEIQRQQIDSVRRQTLLTEKANLESLLATGNLPYFPSQLAQAALDKINNELGGGLLIDSGEGALSDPGVGGTSQWTELKIPVSEFQRVGSDTSRGWGDVAAFQITINATAAVNVGLSSLWIGGTYGADITGGNTTSPNSSGPSDGYNYVYCARNSSTGTRSNPSPPMRSPILPEREAVEITIPPGYPDTQADFFDIFRAGGTIPDYHLVGSILASGSLTFIDDLPDDLVVGSLPLTQDAFRPWPRSDRPQEGVVDVVGTTVMWVSGDTFNRRWVRNNQIIIDDKVYSFYSNPSSTTVLELNESAGFLEDVTFQIPEPTEDGIPLPIVFGPYGTGVSGEFLFGLGDPLNPGYLYFTNGNDPESASDVNYLTLCDPGETLIGGTLLDGIVYVWSDRRSWRILPSFAGGQTQGGSFFYAQQTSMGKGLAAPWALAAGDRLYFLSYDGIYASRGDAIESLTDESIAPLFRRDGSGINQNFAYGDLAPVSFAVADQKFLSLTYSIDGIYFTYRGTDGGFYSLYYGFLNQGWTVDRFSFDSPTRMAREEQVPGTDIVLYGSAQGYLLQLSATEFRDNGIQMSCQLLTREEDWDDSRAQHQIGDVMFDVDPAGQTIVVSLIYDQGASFRNLDNLTGLTRQVFIRDVNNGLGDLKITCQAQFTWLGSSGCSKLYEWQPSALIKPESSKLRATDWDDSGYLGAKWLQGMRIKGDSFNQTKNLTVQGDDLATISNIQFTADGEQVRAFSWDPFVTHEMRLIGADDDDWRMMDIEWIWEPEPELVTTWQTQFTNLDLQGFFHIRELLFSYRSFSDIDLVLTIDGTSYPAYTIPNSSGQRARFYFPVLAVKGKYFSFTATSSQGFSIYQQDLEVRAGAWGRNDFYNILRPFGDLSRTKGGARI